MDVGYVTWAPKKNNKQVEKVSSWKVTFRCGAPFRPHRRPGRPPWCWSGWRFRRIRHTRTACTPAARCRRTTSWCSPGSRPRPRPAGRGLRRGGAVRRRPVTSVSRICKVYLWSWRRSTAALACRRLLWLRCEREIKSSRCHWLWKERSQHLPGIHLEKSGTTNGHLVLFVFILSTLHNIMWSKMICLVTFWHSSDKVCSKTIWRSYSVGHYVRNHDLNHNLIIFQYVVVIFQINNFYSEMELVCFFYPISHYHFVLIYGLFQSHGFSNNIQLFSENIGPLGHFSLEKKNSQDLVLKWQHFGGNTEFLFIFFPRITLNKNEKYWLTKATTGP